MTWTSVPGKASFQASVPAVVSRMLMSLAVSISPPVRTARPSKVFSCLAMPLVLLVALELGGTWLGLVGKVLTSEVASEWNGQQSVH